MLASLNTTQGHLLYNVSLLVHNHPVAAIRMSDTHRRSELQGERMYFLGHFTDFMVLEIVEKLWYFVINLHEIIK